MQFKQQKHSLLFIIRWLEWIFVVSTSINDFVSPNNAQRWANPPPPRIISSKIALRWRQLASNPLAMTYFSIEIANSDIQLIRGINKNFYWFFFLSNIFEFNKILRGLVV